MDREPDDAATAGVAVAACGARKRDGTRCALPPAAGRRRCFQHGGARGIGAPKDNRNAWKHGLDGREWLAERRRRNDFMRLCRLTLLLLDEEMKGNLAADLQIRRVIAESNRLAEQCDRASDRAANR
jgi:hypothetical protein